MSPAFARVLIHAIPDIACAVAEAATAKKVNEGGGGAPKKAGSKPPMNINAVADVAQLMHALRKVTGELRAWSVLDLPKLYDDTRELSEQVKQAPPESENVLDLAHILAKLNTQYPRHDTGTKLDTPCEKCGKREIHTWPVDYPGEPMVHLCSECGKSYTDATLRITHLRAVEIAKHQQAATRREKSARARLEKLYGKLK